MPNGVIGNTTDSGSVKSRFEPWLGNSSKVEMLKNISTFFYHFCRTYLFYQYLCNDYFSLSVGVSR